jgi:hypothetical protein
MKRYQEVLFIGVFLVVIFSVPAGQTVYEFVTNPGHRIQMLDLAEDLLVTPVKKAAADWARLQRLQVEVDSLGIEMAAAQKAKSDTTQKWSEDRSSELADGMVLSVFKLRESVVAYNRHVAGAANQNIHADTTAPYYRTLRALHRDLRDVQKMVTDGEEPAAIAAKIEVAKPQAAAAVAHFGGHKKTILDYPALTLDALRRIMIGNEYLRPYEKEMEKVSIFANGIRPAFQFAYYALFGDLGDKGVLGRNGWFFYRPDVEYVTKNYVFNERSKIVDANDRPFKESIVDSIVSFKNQLAERGIDLLVVIMPGKPSIYPDMLNEKMSAGSAGTFSHSLQFNKELQAAGVETVDLFAAFAEERKRDAESGDSIYLHTDTHFRSRGVLAAARTVAERVKQYSWYQQGATEYEVDTLIVSRDGDIGTMTKLPAMKLRNLSFSFPPESTKCYQVWEVTRDADGAVADRVMCWDTRDNARIGRVKRSAPIMVLGDSFTRIYQTDPPQSAGWASHLARELSQPVFMLYNDGGASTLIRDALVEKHLNALPSKKLVVWEIVERDIRFGEGGWRDVKLAAREE